MESLFINFVGLYSATRIINDSVASILKEIYFFRIVVFKELVTAASVVVK